MTQKLSENRGHNYHLPRYTNSWHSITYPNYSQLTDHSLAGIPFTQDMPLITSILFISICLHVAISTSSSLFTGICVLIVFIFCLSQTHSRVQRIHFKKEERAERQRQLKNFIKVRKSKMSDELRFPRKANYNEKGIKRNGKKKNPTAGSRCSVSKRQRNALIQCQHFCPFY